MPTPRATADDLPKTQCPQCGAWVTDYDGFGVLAHLGPDGCGYCSHPAIDDDVCGICEARIVMHQLPSGAVRREAVALDRIEESTPEPTGVEP